MKTLKTINEKPGYIYSNGTGGKKWIRGRTMFSEGCKYISNNERIPVITKTNLDITQRSKAFLNRRRL